MRVIRLMHLVPGLPSNSLSKFRGHWPRGDEGCSIGDHGGSNIAPTSAARAIFTVCHLNSVGIAVLPTKILSLITFRGIVIYIRLKRPSYQPCSSGPRCRTAGATSKNSDDNDNQSTIRFHSGKSNEREKSKVCERKNRKQLGA